MKHDDSGGIKELPDEKKTRKVEKQEIHTQISKDLSLSFLFKFVSTVWEKNDWV